MPKNNISNKNTLITSPLSHLWILGIIIGTIILITAVVTYTLTKNEYVVYPEVTSPVTAVTDYPQDTDEDDYPTATPAVLSSDESYLAQCTVDTDCVSVTRDACGQGPDFSINKKYVSFWEEKYPRPTGVNCIQSLHISPRSVCAHNMCKVIPHT